MGPHPCSHARAGQACDRCDKWRRLPATYVVSETDPFYCEEAGKTCIEYDRPSSLFGRLGDARVDEVAASLDRKLADLAAEAMR